MHTIVTTALEIEQRIRHRLKLLLRFTLGLTVGGSVIAGLMSDYLALAVVVVTAILSLVSLRTLSTLNRASWIFLISWTLLAALVMIEAGPFSPLWVLVVLLPGLAVMLNKPAYLYVYLPGVAMLLLYLAYHDSNPTENYNNHGMLRHSFYLLLPCIGSSIIAYLVMYDNQQLADLMDLHVEKIRHQGITIETQAKSNQYTGLPNRLALEIEFHKPVPTQGICLVKLRLNDLKSVTDTYGPQQGQKVINLLAQRFRNSPVVQNAVYQIKGDDLMFFLAEQKTSLGLQRLTEHIRSVTQEQITLGVASITLNCTLGICNQPMRNSLDDALHKTALALSWAESHCAGSDCLYHDEMGQAIIDRYRLIEDLINALAQHEFILHFQPIISLQSGRIAGAEALVRWQSPTRGFVQPDRFIAIAEKSGQIHQLGDWIMAESLNFCHRIQQQHPDFFISINFSPLQLVADDFLERFCHILDQSQVSPHTVNMEITESEQLSQAITETIQAVEALGVKIVIDDFGTGYSNLGHLHQARVTKLKLDRSFITNLEANPQNRTIVKAVQKLATELNIQTVAEGVETRAELEVLRSIGTDFIQGYYFSKPITELDFNRLLLDSAFRLSQPTPV